MSEQTLQPNEPLENETDREATPEDLGALEAILFTMGEPVELNKLAAAIQLSPKRTKVLLEQMEAELDAAERGIRLLRLEKSYQLCTKKEYFEQIIAIAKQATKPRLTEVMMETLSIVAYKQPVTKAEIEQIRGVKSDHAVNRLVEFDLIREVGRLDAPGRPLLFGTTDTFLRHFGLTSSGELPELSAVQLEDFRAEAEAEAAWDEKDDSDKIRVDV